MTDRCARTEGSARTTAGGTRGGRVPIAVFASGSGTNLQRLMDVERADADWPAEIRLVVSDKPACTAVERARRAGIAVFAASPGDYPDKGAFEQAILAQLSACGIEWIVLAGYMRIVGPTLLRPYEGRILNIHPSLLPSFPGRHAVRDALAAGVRETGVTVHLVDEGVDTGPVVAQERVPVDPGMTEEALLERIHKVEHELYPRVIRQLLGPQVSSRAAAGAAPAGRAQAARADRDEGHGADHAGGC